jgi:hypothetical protein
MGRGVENGPVASGDGKAVEQLNIQDLRNLRATAAKLNISQERGAVKAACGDLDEQEGYGWLAADCLGVTLVHSYKAPTEAQWPTRSGSRSTTSSAMRRRAASG